MYLDLVGNRIWMGQVTSCLVRDRTVLVHKIAMLAQPTSTGTDKQLSLSQNVRAQRTIFLDCVSAALELRQAVLKRFKGPFKGRIRPSEGSDGSTGSNAEV